MNGLRFREVLDQSSLFFDWARQYPHLWRHVEASMLCIEFLADVVSHSAYTQLRDSFQMLFMYANEGDFPQSAALFSECYVYCARFLLLYFPDAWKGEV